MISRIFENMAEVRDPEQLLLSWRQERAFRIGRVLTCIGVVLGLLATVVDLQFSDQLAIYADLVFLGGCFISLLLTRSEPGKPPYFFWWPAYVGLWIASLPTLFISGGIQSPFLGLYLVLLLLAALIIQTEVRPTYVFGFVFLNLLGWGVLEVAEFVPSPQPLVPAFAFSNLALLGASVVACALVFFKAERDLAREIMKGHQDLGVMKADLAREEAANSAKSAFLANISHELRTPLGAILGYAELALEKEASGEDEIEYIETIQRNARQLAKLVDDLLDISKIEADKIEIEPSPFRPRDLLEEVTELLRLNAEKKGLKLSLEVGGGFPQWFEADHHRIRQVLINMVGNAVKFTDHGAVTVKSGYESDLRGQGGRLRIDVVDTGRGLSVEEQARLFKPFSQADTRVSRQYGGTGLGLYLARKLSMLMGGELRLTSSERGLGSVFSFICPVRVLEEKEIASMPNTTEDMLSLRRLDGTRVLVVDDAPDNQKLVCTYLKAVGAVTSCAGDGFEAINQALTGKFDIVIMDVQMPVLDGQCATRMLRQKGFGRPIVALTAHAMAEDRERCREAGFTAYLAKPVDRRVLIQTIAEVSKKTALNTSDKDASFWR